MILRMASPARFPWLSVFGSICLLANAVFAETAVFPIKVGPTRRYLVDQSGVPFLMQADSAWSLMVALDHNEVTQYLESRQAKGFNALVVNLIEHKFQGGDSAFLSPTNRYGQAPFLARGDFSKPNEDYFTNADWVIAQAAAKGMVVVLFPDYLGYPGSDEGWCDETLANGVEKCRQYGRYVGNRYKNSPNVIWAMYGDRNPDAAQPMVDAMAAGVQEADTNHIFTVHLQRRFIARKLLHDPPWLQLTTAYSDSQTFTACLATYAESPVMPFFLIESIYSETPKATGATLRAQAYWADLSGACGQTFGNENIWQFKRGWQKSINDEGAACMSWVKALFLSRAWYKLIPDETHTIVTSSYGKGASHVAAARTSDGATLIAYLPTGGGAITVDMEKLAGPRVQVWWFNPSSGKSSNAGVLPGTGRQEFKPPDANDWVLVLDELSRHFQAPGTFPFIADK